MKLHRGLTSKSKDLTRVNEDDMIINVTVSLSHDDIVDAIKEVILRKLDMPQTAAVEVSFTPLANSMINANVSIKEGLVIKKT